MIAQCYNQAILADPQRRPVYFGALKHIAEHRQSDVLSTKFVMLESEGEVTQEDINGAFNELGIDPDHATSLNEEHILSKYQSLLPSVGPQRKENLRKALKIIGQYTGNAKIKAAAQDSRWI